MHRLVEKLLNAFKLSFPHSDDFEIELFSDLTDSDKVKLARVCHKKSFKRDEEIYHQGQPAEAVYFLLHGSVGIYQQEQGGVPHRVRYVTPYGVIGAAALFTDAPRDCSAKALEDSSTLPLLRSDFRELCDTNPALALKLLLIVGAELNSALETMEKEYMSLVSRLTRANIVV